MRLDDGIIVGDPMEKTGLEALDWQLSKGMRILYILLFFLQQWFVGDKVAPQNSQSTGATELHIRRRFQFSSALKRMSTVSTMKNGRVLAAVKGAPEVIKTMLADVPKDYDDTYKWFTRRGSRVLALGAKYMDSLSNDKVLFI